MGQYDDQVLAEAVNKVTPHLPLGEGGKQNRGPNRTFDFFYQVWIEKALIQTRHLPILLEQERQKYLQHKKLIEEIGRKGKYTNTFGWSEKKEFLWDFNISRPLYQYFAIVVGPFLGFDKNIWGNTRSRIWERIKKMIITGDKVKIAKFTKDIEKKLMKQRGKKIMGAFSGAKDTDSSTKETQPAGSI